MLGPALYVRTGRCLSSCHNHTLPSLVCSGRSLSQVEHQKNFVSSIACASSCLMLLLVIGLEPHQGGGGDLNMDEGFFLVPGSLALLKGRGATLLLRVDKNFSTNFTWPRPSSLLSS